MILLLIGCGPFARWPDPATVYPYVVSDEQLLDYETVRWEDGSWDPSNTTQVARYVQKAFNHRKGAPIETLAHFGLHRIPSMGEGLKVALGGDIMYMDQDDWSTYALESASLLEHADLRVGNLETPTSPNHSFEPRELGLYAFNAPPAMLDGLPFDVLQLNNNHSLDAGDDGLEATIDALVERDLVPTGVDAHAVVGEVTVLAYTWGLNDGRVSERHELFVIPFGESEPVPLEDAIRDIEAASTEHVIVMLHWGYEYEYYPDVRFMKMARELVVAGADVVAGHGPHVVQPAEFCRVNDPTLVPGVGSCSLRDDGEPRTAAIFYSLGDFGSEVITVQAKVGIVGSVSLGPDGVSGMGWEGVATTFDGAPRVVPLDSVVDSEYEVEARRLQRHLGMEWMR